MLSLSEIIQSLLSSSIVAAAAIFFIKKFTENAVNHAFDRRMKEYEAKLNEETEVNIKYRGDKIEGYPVLLGKLLRARKNISRMVDGEVKSDHEMEDIRQDIKVLEEQLYDTAIFLKDDGVYNNVHELKNKLVSLRTNIESRKKLLDRMQNDRAAKVDAVINQLSIEIDKECQEMIDKLTTLIKQ